MDGDYWLVDHLPALIKSDDGVVAAGPIQDALGDLDAVRLSVVYAVPGPKGRGPVAVAAVTVREGRELGAEDLDAVLAPLGSPGRPAVVRRVGEIPVTTWFRPVAGPLREEGVPEPSKPAGCWYWDEKRGGYRALTKTARTRLVGST
jgi:putative long chain acyl-CoA synthase